MNEFLFSSPVGGLHIKSSENALVSIEFTDEDSEGLFNGNYTEAIGNTVDQLKEYFEGNRKKFDVPLSPSGTPFQESVWNQLLQIPYGTTTTYSEVSKRLDNPKAVRAVGKANGLNPIPIIIPCHRVIGANQNLTGYAGGIKRKRWLLKHEGALLL